MAEISNQRVVERYKELLANRTHDVIVRDAAIEVLEAEHKKLQADIRALQEELLQVRKELEDQQNNPWEHPTRVVKGEVVGE